MFIKIQAINPYKENELKSTKSYYQNEKMELESEGYEKQISENRLFEKYRKIDCRV